MFFRKTVKPMGEPWSRTWMKHVAGRLGRGMTYTVLDCEMTGLDPKKHELISIGAVRIRDGRIVMKERFYELLQNESEMTRENVLIHRLGHDQVAGGNPPQEVLARFLEFIGQSALVAHCGSLDRGFLDVLCKRHDYAKLAAPMLDTAHIYKWWFHRQDRHRILPPDGLRLETMCRELSVPQHEAHHAFFDALTCAAVFLRLLTEMEAAGIYTFKDMMAISKPRLGPGGI